MASTLGGVVAIGNVNPVEPIADAVHLSIDMQNITRGNAAHLLLVDQTADHLAKCRMLRSSIALAKKVSKLNWREFPTGRLVGAVKNEHVFAFPA